MAKLFRAALAFSTVRGNRESGVQNTTGSGADLRATLLPGLPPFAFAFEAFGSQRLSEGSSWKRVAGPLL